MASEVGKSQLIVGVADPADADREVGWAAALAASLRLSVHLVHVLDPSVGREPIDRAVVIAGDLLAIAASDARLAGLDVTHEVQPGLIDELLPAIAARDAGSVLMLATHQVGLLERVRVGDWSIRVLRRVRAPYILVPPAAVDPRPVTRLVVGVDGSAASDRAADVARSLAGRAGLAVTTVEAIEPASSPGYDFLEGAPVVSDAEVRVRGFASEVIEGVARARGDCLIVVGSHGRGQITRLLLGSTSQYLAHHADRPVLIVPAEGRD